MQRRAFVGRGGPADRSRPCGTPKFDRNALARSRAARDDGLVEPALSQVRFGLGEGARLTTTVPTTQDFALVPGSSNCPLVGQSYACTLSQTLPKNVSFSVTVQIYDTAPAPTTIPSSAFNVMTGQSCDAAYFATLNPAGYGARSRTLVLGPDGALWYATGTTSVGRYDLTTGATTSISMDATSISVASGNDGRLYATDTNSIWSWP